MAIPAARQESGTTQPKDHWPRWDARSWQSSGMPPRPGDSVVVTVRWRRAPAGQATSATANPGNKVPGW